MIQQALKPIENRSKILGTPRNSLEFLQKRPHHLGRIYHSMLASSSGSLACWLDFRGNDLSSSWDEAPSSQELLLTRRRGHREEQQKGARARAPVGASRAGALEKRDLQAWYPLISRKGIAGTRGYSELLRITRNYSDFIYRLRLCRRPLKHSINRRID